MKNYILVIGTEAGWEERKIAESARTHGNSVQIISPHEIRVELHDQGTKIFLREKDFTAQFKKSRIIFRRVLGSYIKMVGLVFLAANWKIQFTDTIKSIVSGLYKTIFLPTIQTQHIRQIPTLFLDQKERLPKKNELTSPYLVKPALGRHGEGVMVFRSRAALANHLAKNKIGILVQNYLKILAEYRVFVVGNESLGSIRKIPKPGSIAANYAAGARFEPAKLPSKIVSEAVSICKQQQIDIGGVDLALTKEGFYLLEVNRCPEFRAFSKTTKINVADAIVKFALAK
ncbi:ATP-grasp domain-containing protein [Patescibacteria group bacterium]|nr:ATP-grasp domain-containing protein [Patescibacteria group bacterium]